MNDIQQLEMLSESIKNEIDELQSLLQHSGEFMLKAKKPSYENMLRNIISNLESTNDSIYRVYEDLNANDHSEELALKNEIMEEILTEKLDDEEKTYIRIKYGIELF